MSSNVALLGWLWLGSPFAVIAVISHDRRLLRLVAAHHRGCRAAGWTGAVMMCVSLVLTSTVLGGVMFWVGTPLVGLAVWLRRDDDGGDDGDDDPDVPPGDWDGDWSEFERSFWAHVRRRGLAAPRPRTPSAR